MKHVALAYMATFVAMINLIMYQQTNQVFWAILCGFNITTAIINMIVYYIIDNKKEPVKVLPPNSDKAS